MSKHRCCTTISRSSGTGLIVSKDTSLLYRLRGKFMGNAVLSARPYKLYFEHRPDYLLAYVHSRTISFDIAKGYWVEILSLLHHRRYKRVLLQKDVPQRLAAHEVFDLVSEIAHSGCKDISFGIFDLHYIEERCRFEEMVGTNRGLRLKTHGD